jgi:hypothetical protein
MKVMEGEADYILLDAKALQGKKSGVEQIRAQNQFSQHLLQNKADDLIKNKVQPLLK